MGVVWFFLRGRKKERDEMGLFVFLIGVPRNIRSAKKEFVMSLSFCRNTLPRFKIVIGPITVFLYVW